MAKKRVGSVVVGERTKETDSASRELLLQAEEAGDRPGVTITLAPRLYISAQKSAWLPGNAHRFKLTGKRQAVVFLRELAGFAEQVKARIERGEF